jgi:putative Mn2+ efflux pump MntP
MDPRAAGEKDGVGMHLTVILIIAIGLAMDALAVSVGAGMGGRAGTRRTAIRISSHFGLFQFLMPIVGWSLGAGIAPLIASCDHWIAFGLLCIVGGRMILSGSRIGPQPSIVDHTRGIPLIVLSLATSIDALAVGLSFGVLGISIWYPSAVIGIVTFILSYAGARLGNRLGARFGNRMEILGGIVLILIGIRILILHLSSPV